MCNADIEIFELYWGSYKRKSSKEHVRTCKPNQNKQGTKYKQQEKRALSKETNLTRETKQTPMGELLNRDVRSVRKKKLIHGSLHIPTKTQEE